MGVHPNVTARAFPQQSPNVGRRVEVCFHYDTSAIVGGVIVRDDQEDPFETIIRLDDGRYVRSVECQYTLDLGRIPEPPASSPVQHPAAVILDELVEAGVPHSRIHHVAARIKAAYDELNSRKAPQPEAVEAAGEAANGRAL